MTKAKTLAICPEQGSFISLQMVPLRSPGHACLVPISGFPLPGQEARSVETFLTMLVNTLAVEWNISSEVFLQLTQFQGCQARLAKHEIEWMPELGLGIWPDRPGPSLWTGEEIMSLGLGEKLRPLMNQLLRITGTAAVREGARKVMLDAGPILEIMSSRDANFLARAKKLLLERIEQPNFRVFPFYVPLLERKSLEAATPEDLDAWFSGASVYIRESFEDGGILIAAREPLRPIMEKLGGRYEESPEPRWKIPV